MSYQTYTTEAIVCASFDNNIADKSYQLFTKTAGMLYASARSVREERSRQRYALQDFSLINVSLIKGKSGWRIGSVQSEGNLFSKANNRSSRGSVVRLFKFLRRFVQGEESSPELFTEVLQSIHFLSQDDLPQRAVVEEIICVRILYSLGYIAHTSAIKDILETPLLQILQSEHKDELLFALKNITDTATKASHL